jgi:hypothetical protein
MGESLRLKLSHDNSSPGLSNPKHGFLDSSKNVMSVKKNCKSVQHSCNKCDFLIPVAPEAKLELEVDRLTLAMDFVSALSRNDCGNTVA